MDISTQRGTPDNPEADTRRPQLVAFCVTARLPASVTARGPAPIGMRDTRDTRLHSLTSRDTSTASADTLVT